MNVYKLIRVLASLSPAELCEVLKGIDGDTVRVVKSAVSYYKIILQLKLEEVFCANMKEGLKNES